MSLLALLLITQLENLDFEGPMAEAEQVVRTVRASSRPEPRPFEYLGEATPGPVRWDIGAPATKASKKLLELTQSIDATRTDTLYSHRTRVRRKDGIYHFDCSGMINWMLERVAETSLETIDRERPVAASYVRVIKKAPTSRSRGGWQQIAIITDVEPGDVFAWKRPADWPKGGNSGHVGVVLARPAPVPHIKHAYVVRIADSTRWRHQDDTRSEDETGFGMGTILFMTDGQGQPIGYAWFGSESGGYYETDVVFGRVH
jgi:hypothetical protein